MARRIISLLHVSNRRYLWNRFSYLTPLGTRHACDQGDGLSGYTWTEYDARDGGVQVIKDGPNNVEITTEFLKVPGGEHGGSWAVRVKGKPMNAGMSLASVSNMKFKRGREALPSRVSTIFYAGLEGLGGLDMENEEQENVSGVFPTLYVADSP